MKKKEESEIWKIVIENMEILGVNDLMKGRSLSIYGGFLTTTSAFQEKIKQVQIGEFQEVRGYCDVYHPFDPKNMEKCYNMETQNKKKILHHSNNLCIAKIFYFKCKYLEHTSRGSKYTLAHYLGLCVSFI